MVPLGYMFATSPRATPDPTAEDCTSTVIGILFDGAIPAGTQSGPSTWRARSKPPGSSPCGRPRSLRGTKRPAALFLRKRYAELFGKVNPIGGSLGTWE